jgi:hypothetical protein
MILKGVVHISPLRGGSQAQIMRVNNGAYFAVKFQGNPQHTRVLANEYLACRLAQLIGLSVSQTVILEVEAATIRDQNIAFTFAERRVPVKPGLQFGSSLIRDEQTLDWLPRSLLGRIENVQEFLGVLAFDKWTCNADGRQAIFHRGRQQGGYTATFIDFGYAFNAGEWTFPDAPLRGTYAMNDVYMGARSLNDFAPWLQRIARISTRELEQIAAEVPTECYGEAEDMERLLEELLRRREMVPQLIEDFRTSSRNPFPEWHP